MPEFQDPEIYRTILEALKIGLCVVDRQKKIIFWSDGAENITGYRRHEVVGHECVHNILKHCDGKRCELCGAHCPLTAVLRDARPVEATCSLHHKAGHRLFVHLQIVPLRDQHGSLIGAVETFEGRHLVPHPDRRQQSLGAHGFLDTITGVANQSMMQTRMRVALTTYLEMNVPFGILCVQPDQIERFRANYGQEATNSILRVTAQTLDNSIRPTDFVGRWGEDGFVVLLTNCKIDSLEAVRNRIRAIVASDSIDWWGEERRIAVSIEKTTAQAGDTLESLLQRVQQSFPTNSAEEKGLAAAASASDQSAPSAG
jgi:diguanylate cyclase (GGDEF)-like protein/PAS domain S-box-containing protein